MSMNPRAIRESLGLSQMQMAVKAGLSIATIQDFEAGTVRATPRTRGKLSVGYEVQPQDVLSFLASQRESRDATPKVAVA